MPFICHICNGMYFIGEQHICRKENILRTNCTICDDVAETRYIDLFVVGSEGTRLCHNCEMLVVEFVREKQRANLKRRIMNHKRGE